VEKKGASRSYLVWITSRNQERKGKRRWGTLPSPKGVVDRTVSDHKRREKRKQNAENKRPKKRVQQRKLAVTLCSSEDCEEKISRSKREKGCGLTEANWCNLNQEPQKKESNKGIQGNFTKWPSGKEGGGESRRRK